MTIRARLFLLSVLATGVLTTPIRSRVVAADLTVAAQCTALAEASFSRVQDAPTNIAGSKLVRAHDGVTEYCEVRGSVAPTVDWILVLPTSNWNGKFLELGCGGFCGTMFDGSDYFNAAFWEKYDFLAGPLRRRYAILLFDGGHTGDVRSALWAYNNLQAQIDFGIRAPHVAALAGKAVTQQYYGSAPVKSYFWGCSSGGQQALSEAQRFPWDFDGILAGAPSPTFSGPMMNYLWAGRALAGKVKQSDLKLLHDRAVARCDLDDGVKDGVIGDPLRCKFDPKELLCRADQKRDCLTAPQVEAVKKVYSGPMTSRGEKTYTGGPLIGSELNWIPAYVNDDGTYNSYPASEYFSYVGFMPAPGVNWKPADFDFDRDYKRLRMAESLFGAADNPDLRIFRGVGAKLILYQGAQDESDIPTDAIDYYQTVEKTMGGRPATQDFFRLFLVPGMDHCTDGAGAFAIDYLTYLESWVEQHRAPDKLVGAHIENVDGLKVMMPRDPSIPVSFTRPIYPYPVRARYSGHGNPNEAASFDPVQP
jgi:hypothetical protein